MGIQVSWDNTEKTAVRFDYGQDWSWADFTAALQQSKGMIATVSQTVDLIANFTDGTLPPADALLRFSRALQDSPPNVGIVVIVGGGAFITVLVKTFNRMYRALGEREPLFTLRHEWGVQGARWNAAETRLLSWGGM